VRVRSVRDDRARIVSRAGGVDVVTVTDELTADWWGGPVRTFEAAVPEERLGLAWRMFAYQTWLRLNRLDGLLHRIVPDSLYYNVSVTALKP
jgi:hypothetical protein